MWCNTRDPALLTTYLGEHGLPTGHEALARLLATLATYDDVTDLFAVTHLGALSLTRAPRWEVEEDYPSVQVAPRGGLCVVGFLPARARLSMAHATCREVDLLAAVERHLLRLYREERPSSQRPG